MRWAVYAKIEGSSSIQNFHLFFEITAGKAWFLSIAKFTCIQIYFSQRLKKNLKHCKMHNILLKCWLANQIFLLIYSLSCSSTYNLHLRLAPLNTVHPHRSRPCVKNLNCITSNFIFYLLIFQKLEEGRRTAVAATEIQVFTRTGGNERIKWKTAALHKNMDLDALVWVLSPELFITL